MANINDKEISSYLEEGGCVKSASLDVTLSKSSMGYHFRHYQDGNILPCAITLKWLATNDWEVVIKEHLLKAIANKFRLARDQKFNYPVYFMSSRITQSCEEANEYPPLVLWCREKDYVLPRLTLEQEETFIQLIKQNG